MRNILREAGVSKDDSSDVWYSKLAPYRVPVLQGFLRALADGIAQRHEKLIVMLISPGGSGGSGSGVFIL